MGGETWRGEGWEPPPRPRRHLVRGVALGIVLYLVPVLPILVLARPDSAWWTVPFMVWGVACGWLGYQAAARLWP